MKQLLVAFGTRPEFIKLKPVLNVLNEKKFPHKILFTNQHQDILEDFDEDLSIDIRETENRLDSIVASVLRKEKLFLNIGATLVQGDTASAFAVALASFHRQIPVIHLEAGLRTNKQTPFPEESYRRSISALASIHLCPTQVQKITLERESVFGSIHVVGNSVLDNLKDVKIEYSNEILVTMHRRENLDELQNWFSEIDKLAKEFPQFEFVLPVHPNPLIKEKAKILKHVKVVKHMDHAEFISRLARCKLVITDSGGIQEEASFLRKKGIVCRDDTERKEALGKFFMLCPHPRNLREDFLKLKDDFIPRESDECPFGDGETSIKTYEIIKRLFKTL